MEHFNTYGFPETKNKEKDLLGVIEWSKIKGETLEIGSGTGRFLRQFKAKGLRVIGADTSKNMAEIARQYSDVIIAPANKLPFENGKFDNVLIHGVIHHNKKWKPIIKEINRVWNGKGFLIIGLVLKGSWFYYFRKYKPRFRYFSGESNLIKQLNDWFHAPYYFIPEKELIEEVGLRPIKKSKTSAGALTVLRFKGPKKRGREGF